MNDNQDDSKSIKAGFSAPSDIILRAKEKAGANFSAYITSLIERDLENRPAQPLAKTVIVDLARPLIGELDSQDLEEKLSGLDQRRMLQSWLLSLLHDESDDFSYAEKTARERLDIRAAIKAQESPAQKILREAREREKNSGVA